MYKRERARVQIQTDRNYRQLYKLSIIVGIRIGNIEITKRFHILNIIEHIDQF